ncbi:MAG: hypothetical protein WBK37_08895 [Kiritimatiellia bacterium]
MLRASQTDENAQNNLREPCQADDDGPLFLSWCQARAWGRFYHQNDWRFNRAKHWREVGPIKAEQQGQFVEFGSHFCGHDAGERVFPETEASTFARTHDGDDIFGANCPFFAEFRAKKATFRRNSGRFGRN